MEFFAGASAEILSHFRQISFEFHNPFSEDNVTEYLSRLNQTHQVVWVHANNNGEVLCGKETSIPTLLEITYARRDCFEFKDARYNGPLPIDSPNIAYYKDIPMMDWGTIHD